MAADLQSALIAAREHLNVLWNLVESNHVLRIFSPAHTPCLPKFHVLEEAKGFEPLRRFTAFQFSGLAQSTKLCQTSMFAENNGLEPLRRFAGLTR